MLPAILPAQEPTPPKPGDKMLAAYFRRETRMLMDRCLADVQTLEEWEKQKPIFRQQLFEMLGLNPLPERTPLNAVVTGTLEHDEFIVEKLHFQSQPGLYVTGNFYLPKVRAAKLPAILYVCGHSRQVKDGVSFGNKAGYQHHGAWFARHGYACLTIDSLQLGEIEGTHHGTYGVKNGDRYEQMWWWNNRGYTPAGVEAWNCIRALDYVQSREEVDPERLGVTGRSGGGAYSWWIAALDERIKVAVPVAGITDLWNHVVEGGNPDRPRAAEAGTTDAQPRWTNVEDGCVSGHCDCMYFVNTYRWDYPLVAALVAPRPLLISNTDKDSIFPLEGVVRLHQKVRGIYRLYDKQADLGLQITEGPHKDAQELHLHAFVWFNRYLKNDATPISKPAEKFFQPEQLRVFDKLPSDQRNTRIHEEFVKAAEAPQVPENEEEWSTLRDGWMRALKDKVFRGWPEQSEPLDVRQALECVHEGVQLRAYDFTAQGPFRLRLYLLQRHNLEAPELTVLNVLDEAAWRDFAGSMQEAFASQVPEFSDAPAESKEFESLRGMLARFPWAMAYLAPRGLGTTAWSSDERAQTQIRRRFMLLGQTLDGMRVYDVCRGAQALREIPNAGKGPLWLQGANAAAEIALLAALHIPHVSRVDLHGLSGGAFNQVDVLNLGRVLDLPAAAAMLAEKSQVRIYQEREGGWDYAQAVGAALKWDEKQLQVRAPRGAN